MTGIALIVVVLVLMIMFALSALINSQQTHVNTLSKKELRETIEILQAEQDQVTKQTE
ncbi:MAG: hypothetical protein ACE3JQ_05775 [Paenisporosarcina sp.]